MQRRERTLRAVLTVLGVNPVRVGGAEMYGREVSRQLGEAGWKSHLCFDGEPAPEVLRFLDLPNTTVHVVPGIATGGAAAVRAFARLLAREKPEIVHLGYTPFLSWYVPLARLYGARVYTTVHVSPPEGSRITRAQSWKRLLAAPMARSYTMVITNSDFSARCIAARGYVGPERVRRVYNGVDMMRRYGSGAGFRRRYSIPADCPVVLQASWIIPEKGIEDLLEAARIVIAERPETRFIIAGEGPARAAMMQLAAAMGLAESITWTGLVGDPLGEGMFAAADVVCQLSRWEESFGWAIAEAMASERPVVATRVGAIPELVEDGRTGFLVPRRDPAAAAGGILRLLADAGMRSRFGVEARRAARAKFDLRTQTAEMLNLFGIPSESVPELAAAQTAGQEM